MTNGEKFKEVFKISQVDEGELYAYVWLPNHDAAEISIEWWNAEYQESTTKNDLGVDCISRADAISAVSKALSRIFVEYEDVANKIINKLPSVTPQEPILDRIRADINKLTVYYTTEDKGTNLISQRAVNRIFDKYKATRQKVRNKK